MKKKECETMMKDIVKHLQSVGIKNFIENNDKHIKYALDEGSYVYIMHIILNRKSGLLNLVCEVGLRVSDMQEGCLLINELNSSTTFGKWVLDDNKEFGRIRVFYMSAIDLADGYVKKTIEHHIGIAAISMDRQVEETLLASCVFQGREE